LITQELHAVTSKARDARDDPRLSSPEARARLLNAIAASLRNRGEAIVSVARQETQLADARLNGELERTAGQLEMFAALTTAGDFYDAVIDLPDPDAKPIPRPDLRRARLPRGPVAVFGAGNFPLAFGVAGGDTASALATGSPVVSKSHSGHIKTDELVAGLIDAAIEDLGLHPGTHSLLHVDHAGAGALVQAPEITAVAFTGSTAAGLRLAEHARGRESPIPVFAEMGSSNPAVLTPAATVERGPAVAATLADAILTSAGQLCTKPGLVLVPADEAGDAFCEAFAEKVGSSDAGPLLGESTGARYRQSVGEMSEIGDLELISNGGRSRPDGDATPYLWATTVAVAAKVERVREEVFGPAAVLIRYRDAEELLSFLSGLEGQLSVSIFSENSEAELRERLIETLTPICGRIVFDAPTTGVAVCLAQQHGGPYPATLDDAYTSVGGRATDRFVRPVAFQNCPGSVLPAPLRDENPLGIWRMGRRRPVPGPREGKVGPGRRRRRRIELGDHGPSSAQRVCRPPSASRRRAVYERFAATHDPSVGDCLVCSSSALSSSQPSKVRGGASPCSSVPLIRSVVRSRLRPRVVG
jgi:NADP-dependent aldehyde dehydrogenase